MKSISHEILREKDFTKNVYTFSHRFHGFFLKLKGSGYNGGSLDYPGVPFGYNDFHQPYCEINNYQDPQEVRNCYLVSLNDINGGSDYVRGKIADYINDLINIGVKGFRVDASKHMWPGDLEAIQASIEKKFQIFFVKSIIQYCTTGSFTR